jgi:hypothetical protein
MEQGSDGLSAKRLSIIRIAQQSSFIDLAGIKFDDGLFVGDRLDLIACRNAHDYPLQGFFV